MSEITISTLQQMYSWIYLAISAFLLEDRWTSVTMWLPVDTGQALEATGLGVV